jgi:threonine dehydratase
MAVRRADPHALVILKAGLERLVMVDDGQIAQAMRDLYTDTHNLAEGAGAASFAAAWSEKDQLKGLKVGTTLCGGNVDSALFGRVLSQDF